MYIFNYSLFGENLHGDDDHTEKTWYFCDDFYALSLFLSLSDVLICPLNVFPDFISLLTHSVRKRARAGASLHMFARVNVFYTLVRNAIILAA